MQENRVTRFASSGLRLQRDCASFWNAIQDLLKLQGSQSLVWRIQEAVDFVLHYRVDVYDVEGEPRLYELRNQMTVLAVTVTNAEVPHALNLCEVFDNK